MRIGMILWTILFEIPLSAKECVPEKATRVWGAPSRDYSHTLISHPAGRYVLITGDEATWLHDLQGAESARRIPGHMRTKLSAPSGDFVLSESSIEGPFSSTLQTFSSFQGPAPVRTALGIVGRSMSLVEIERSANQIRLLRVGADASITEIRANLNADGSVGAVQLERKGNLCSTILDPQTSQLNEERKRQLEQQVASLEAQLLEAAKQTLILSGMRDRVSDRRGIDPKFEASSTAFNTVSGQLDSVLRELRPSQYELPRDFATDGEWVIVIKQNSLEAFIAKIDGNNCIVKRKVNYPSNSREISFHSNSGGNLPQILDFGGGADWNDLATGRVLQRMAANYATYPSFFPDGRIVYLEGGDQVTLNLVDPNQRSATNQAQKEANCIEKTSSSVQINSSSGTGRR